MSDNFNQILLIWLKIYLRFPRERLRAQTVVAVETQHFLWIYYNCNLILTKIKTLGLCQTYRGFCNKIRKLVIPNPGYWKILQEWWASLKNLLLITFEIGSLFTCRFSYSLCITPQVVIWRGYAGWPIIPKGFSNTPGLYRQDYNYNT